MRILHLDLDSLRADHLACYGYGRATAPQLDALAAAGRRYTACHCSDAPCLPSRTAMYSGRFGLTTGVVDHGGSRAAPFRPRGGEGFRPATATLPGLLRAAGYRTATVSSFPDRHAAWPWLDGFAEWIDPGGRGHETAEAVEAPTAAWLDRHGREEDWFLHVNLWDAHVPYRTPAAFGDPFADQPPVSWPDADELARQVGLPGLRSARDSIATRFPRFAGPRQPAEIRDRGDLVRLIDGYDCAIRYADAAVGRLLDRLDGLGLREGLAVLVTADHGEAFGELGGWAAHCSAVPATMRIPAILVWPGRIEPGSVDDGPCYHFDLAATLLDLAGVAVPAGWHARSIAGGADRGYLICSLLAQCAQRAVRFAECGGTWWYLRTWHDGWHGLPPESLFDLDADPQLRRDLAGERGETLARGRGLLAAWVDAHSGDHGDPLDEVLADGGPQMVRGKAADYRRRLAATGRDGWIDRLSWPEADEETAR